MEKSPNCSQRDLLRKKINICMTNTDNTYGTFNKKTQILTATDNGFSAPTIFATVAEAKAYFFTDAALAVLNECCTELQWALVGTTGLKYTMTFGTKGGNIAAADDWAETYHSRRNALVVANQWIKKPHDTQVVDSHLF